MAAATCPRWNSVKLRVVAIDLMGHTTEDVLLIAVFMDEHPNIDLVKRQQSSTIPSDR